MYNYLCPFLSVAVVITLFYFCRAVSITREAHEREVYNRNKKPDEFNNENFFFQQKWVKVAHQSWFNVLGSLIGWIALYFLLDKVLNEKGVSNFGAEHFIALVIAYLGITGYLPQVVLLGIPGR